jgi:hypothetical protein
MPTPLTRRALAIRVVGFVLALGLGGFGVWLLVTGDSQKQAQIGALASFWGLLIGSFVMFGSRRGDSASAESSRAPEAVRAPELAGPTVIQLAQAAQLARLEEAAAHREHEQRLEHMIRHEVQSTVSSEMAGLRSELVNLRSELLDSLTDRVGGQLRLERIETTRVIGSDIEALQREVQLLRDRALHAPDPVRAVRTADAVVSIASESVSPPVVASPLPMAAPPASGPSMTAPSMTGPSIATPSITGLAPVHGPQESGGQAPPGPAAVAAAPPASGAFEPAPYEPPPFDLPRLSPLPPELADLIDLTPAATLPVAGPPSTDGEAADGGAADDGAADGGAADGGAAGEATWPSPIIASTPTPVDVPAPAGAPGEPGGRRAEPGDDYRGRRRKTDSEPVRASGGGRHGRTSPEGETLLSQLLARESID